MTDAIQPVPLDEDAYYQDPAGFFARLRESRPVAPVRMPGYGRAWMVTRYADVRTVLSDPRLAMAAAAATSSAGLRGSVNLWRRPETSGTVLGMFLPRA